MARILIIDDRPADRELLLTFLGYYGHMVVAARDGVEGLALALAEPPDLIITDITMPVMDGYALARRVRADPELSRTRLMFYTGANLSAEMRQIAAECEVTHILTKPAEPETILHTVNAALDRPPPAARPAPDAELDRTYLRLLTSALRRNVDELKAEIHAREQAEGEVRRLNAELEQRVAQLTVANQQLQQEAAERQRAERFLDSVLQQMPSGVTIAEAPSGQLLMHNAEAVQLLRHPLRASADDTEYAQYGALHEDGRTYAPEEYPIARALLTHEVVYQEEMIYRRGDGTITTFTINAAPIRTSEGRVVAAVSTFHDIADRKQADMALRAALTAELSARRTAEILQAASQALASTLDQDTILTTLLEHLAHLVPYDSANVLLLQPDGELVVGMQRGDADATDPGQPDRRVVDPTAAPLLHELISARRSVLASHTRQDPRWTCTSSEDHLLSWFGVPLLAGGELIGLYAASKTMAGFFTQDHVRRAEALAAPAAIAMQNARLFDALHQGHARLQALSQRLVTIQEAERRHIARELHDEIGQLLTGLRLTLELIARLPPSDQATRLAEARAAVQDLIAHVRSLSLDLRPAMLDDMGLLAALLWHFRRYTEQTAITVECKHRGLDRRFPAAVETVAYRVVQEALTNVARHAGVTAVDVWLLATPEQLSVRISDAGRGFDTAAALQAPRSSGLLGMQERVTLLGGSLSITSALGDGTQVVADLPLSVSIEGEGHDDHDRPR